DSTMLFQALFKVEYSDKQPEICKHQNAYTLLRLNNRGLPVSLLRNNSLAHFNCPELRSLISSKGISNFIFQDTTNKNVLPHEWENYTAHFSFLSRNGSSSLHRCRDENDKILNGREAWRYTMSHEAMTSNNMFLCPNTKRLADHISPFGYW